MVEENQEILLEAPHQEGMLKTWCDRFDGLCKNDGDLKVLSGDASGMYLGGTFVLNALGMRLHIEVKDYEWQPYDYDRDEGDEPLGYNTVVTTVVDLDKNEILMSYYEEQCDEDDFYQGLASLSAKIALSGENRDEDLWERLLYELRDKITD